MAADSLDIALGSGPALAFIVKGSPIKASPRWRGRRCCSPIVVRPDGPKTVADLKGKKISVSTAGSLTYWLVSETVAPAGLGAERHRHRADGRHAAADRGARSAATSTA